VRGRSEASCFKNVKINYGRLLQFGRSSTAGAPSFMQLDLADAKKLLSLSESSSAPHASNRAMNAIPV
jgi:hypothetical protein